MQIHKKKLVKRFSMILKNKFVLSLIYLRLAFRFPKVLQKLALNIEKANRFLLLCKKRDSRLRFITKLYNFFSAEKKKEYLLRVKFLFDAGLKQYKMLSKLIRINFLCFWNKEKQDFIWCYIKKQKKTITFPLIQRAIRIKMHKFLVYFLKSMKEKKRNFCLFSKLILKINTLYPVGHELSCTDQKPLVLWINQEAFGYASIFNVLKIVNSIKTVLENNTIIVDLIN